MSNFVYLGQSISVAVTFISWDDTNNTGGTTDPSTVVGYIKNASKVVLSTFTPVNDSVGVYSYEWTPTSEGEYYIEFRGTFATGATPTVQSIEELFTVAASSISFDLTQTLGEDQVLNFMPQLTPVYLDPDEISRVFPDATLSEINEFLFIYSTEVDELLGADAVKTTLVLDYIKAATLCSLSKIYEFGDSDLSSFTLGDLSVTTRSYAKASVTRANATSWCELAAALREEMIGKQARAGMKSIVKGDAYPNPIPSRQIERKEST